MPVVRVNFNTYESGEQYTVRLIEEAGHHLQILMTLLSTYWKSPIEGPNYTRHLKNIALDLSRIGLALDDIRSDNQYSQVRTDFLYQVLTSILFPKNPPGAPNMEYNDLDFREFLINIVKVYFQGSVPESIQQAMELLTNKKVVVKESYKEAEKPGSLYDISDQFSFTIDVYLSNPNDINTFLTDVNAKILLDIIRPAHTLYKLKYILSDTYTGNLDPSIGNLSEVLDSMRWSLSNYSYDDFRNFCDGVYGIDYLGVKKPIDVFNEDHTGEF